VHDDGLVADDRLESVTTTLLATDHPEVKTSRSLTWPLAVVWLLLVACVEWTLSYALLQLGKPIDLPALAVACAGFGLGLLGYFVGGALKEKGRVEVPASVRRALAIGTFSLPILSLGWNFGGSGFWVLPAACLVAVLGCLVLVVGIIGRRKARLYFVTVLLMTASIVVSFFLGNVPNALSLKFARNYEAGLTKQLSAPPEPTEFDMPGQANWYFDYGWKAPVDVCARHLLGPWWEGTNPTPSCPIGFIFVAGP
jgi:hypothetical protein